MRSSRAAPTLRRRVGLAPGVASLAVLVLALPGLVLASGAPPRAVVDRLEEAFIASMKAGTEGGFAERYRLLAPVVDSSYDLPYIAQVVLGRHWDGLDAEQRERFVETFERLVVSNYAAELDSYDGHAFKSDAEKPLKRGRVLVRSRLVRTGDEPDRFEQFDYVLHEDEGQWRIVNVVVNGVSDLAVKRAEYAAVIDTGGFDALLAELAQQITRYEGHAPPDAADRR